MSFNRTSLELKLLALEPSDGETLTFNRTSLELKRGLPASEGAGGVYLLIAPVWN